MLFKHSIKKYASLILILSILLNVIPGTFATAECLNNYAPKLPAKITASVVHMDITFIAVDNKKTISYSISPDIYDCLTGLICISDVPEYKSIYNHEIAVFPKEIKKAILHYFHASKYKDGSFLI